MFGLLLFAVALDVAYFVVSRRPGTVLSTPMGDSVVYQEVAAQLTSGGAAAQTAFFWSPLYSLIVIPWAHASPNALILLQMLAGLVTLWFVFLTGRSLASCRAGFLAALFLALYEPFLMEQGKVLPVTFATLMLALGLRLCVERKSETQNPNDEFGFRMSTFGLASSLNWLLSGFCFGVAGLLMPQLLIVPGLTLVGIIIMGIRRKASGLRLKALVPALLLSAGILIPILPVTIRNAVVAHDFVPVSSAGGFNLYLGFNANCFGLVNRPAEMYEFKPGGQPMLTIREHEKFQQMFAEHSVGHALRPSETSAFWTRRAIEFMRTHAAKTLRLIAAKTLLSLTNYEFADSYYPELERGMAWPLRVTLLPWAIILGLGLVGVVFTWWQRNRMWPVYATVLGVAAGLLIFLVNSRYRQPMVPAMCLLGALGIEAVLQDQRRRLLVGAVIVAATIVLSAGVLRAVYAKTIRLDEAYGWRNFAIDAEKLNHPDLALDMLDQGATLTAQSDQRAAVGTASYDFGMAYLALGNIASDSHSLAVAHTAYDRAIEVKPDLGPAWLMRGVLELGLHQPAAALNDAEQAIRMTPQFANGYVLKAHALLDLGRRGEAVNAAEFALDLGPEEPLVKQLARELGITAVK